MENKTTIDVLIQILTKRINDSLGDASYLPVNTAELVNALANLIEARAEIERG
jgi:hypothetical protein